MGDNHVEEKKSWNANNAIVVSNSCRKENKVIIQPSSTTPVSNKIIKQPPVTSPIQKNTSKPSSTTSNPITIIKKDEIPNDFPKEQLNEEKEIEQSAEETMEQLNEKINYLEKQICIWKDIANELQQDILKLTDISNS